MRDRIVEIINEIPTNSIFDSHTVIFRLMQVASDDYLNSYTGKTTENYHSQIAKIIAGLETELSLERIGESWSKNIRDNFSKCTCWRKS